MKAGILYISYDGMLEPLGQSQVLSYLERLAPRYRIHLVSFEKRSDWDNREARALMSERIASARIDWHPLHYHSRPTVPATAWDMAVGAATAIWLIRAHRLSVIHARSYVAGLIGLAAKRTTGVKLLFDMRGFWADERVDGGLWPAGGRLFQGAKAAERHLLLAADHIVTLTHASADEIARFPYLQKRSPDISVVPTCADLARFAPRKRSGDDDFTLGYVGSVGTWYLFDEVLACFGLIRERVHSARLLIVNRGEHDFIRGRLAAFEVPWSNVELSASDHAGVPALIARMNVGAAIIKPAYSKIASAPTKLAEYLGCGVPCLGNAGVGDVAEIIEGNQVGVCLPDVSPPAMATGMDRLLRLIRDPELRNRCVATAHRLFSLEAGVESYSRMYDQLTTAR